jgi:putative glutamine amidotransferase
MESLKIGITDCKKFATYESWFNQIEGIEVVNLNMDTTRVQEVIACDGIVLSGGEDIDPEYYNKEEYEQYISSYRDKERDDFEWGILELIQNKKIPFLGICRGMQLTNVFLGGTLIPDLETWKYNNHSMLSDKDDCYHKVEVLEDSLLKPLIPNSSLAINSAHHQAIDAVSPQLRPIAYSEDKVIEAMEWKDPEDKPFMLLVQWHPERMNPSNDPLAIGIKETFLRAVWFNKKDNQ